MLLSSKNCVKTGMTFSTMAFRILFFILGSGTFQSFCVAQALWDVDSNFASGDAVLAKQHGVAGSHKHLNTGT